MKPIPTPSGKLSSAIEEKIKQMKTPPYLKKGDKVAIVCPAGYIKPNISQAYAILESWGLEVVVAPSVTAQKNQFAGDDELRAVDLQQALDDKEIKAIIAGRGGYGTVRIIDQLNFTKFKKNPKWLVGFSDITVLHSHIQRQFGIPTIHGQMAKSFLDASPESLLSLKKALFGKKSDLKYRFSDFPNRSGEAEAILVGGNLAILHSTIGSPSDIKYDNKILFIEDVGEAHYNIDRMLWTLKRAKKLDKLKGLIVGGFTDMRDSSASFGQSIEEIILDKVQEYDFPIAFGCPVGHIADNRALILGQQIKLSVQKTKISIHYID